MSYGIINTSDLTDIANAIRAKLGVQTTYKPSQMADAIESISGGGITPTGTKSITANGTYDVASFASAEVAVPSSGITPTGTKQISVTSNGTTTEDVTNYASVEINTNVVNADYVNALTALGVQSDLANSITALTTYANGVTGESDTNLSDAVHTLGSGYGGGSGGLEYEEGTYTPATDELPTISFANSHSKAPDIVVFANVTSEYTTFSSTTLDAYIYFSFLGLFGAPIYTKDDTTANGYYLAGRRGANATSTSFNAWVYSRNDITAQGFTPYSGGNQYVCHPGQTYKWIAIWK